MPEIKDKKPKNRYAEAVLLLIQNYTAGVSPAIYCSHYFHKFPWRVKELAEQHPTLTYLNNNTQKKNKNGVVCVFKTIVPTCPKPYLINLYNKLNK